MGNSYEFWEEYLENCKNAIEEMSIRKEKIHVDLHMHSNYSADGKQSVKQILDNTCKLGFDIISITDHDTVDAYDEIYNYVKNGLTNPIIIPGIEFTMDNKEYGNQCHLLQLFINPKDNILLSDVIKNKKSMYKRSKIQFKRIEENKALQIIFKKYHIKVSYLEYKKYLYDNNLIPEYDTLCSYLIKKLKECNVTTFNVLNLLEIINEDDIYDDRKKYKKKRYEQLRNKYEYCDNNLYNSRFLLSMLAVKEVDDDWWNEPSSGSLSVNSYGQLKIEELNDKYSIYFAHPTEKKLNIVNKIIRKYIKICGIELNIRNQYEDIKRFYDILESNNLEKIIGSDSHDNKCEFYKDMSFYEISTDEIIKIIGRK